MSVGDFTQEEAQVARECIEEIYNALNKKKQAQLLGEYNEALCFVETAGRMAPSEND